MNLFGFIAFAYGIAALFDHHDRSTLFVLAGVWAALAIAVEVKELRESVDKISRRMK